MDQDELQTTEDSINRSVDSTRANGKLSKAFMEFAELVGRRIAEKWGAQCDSSCRNSNEANPAMNDEE